MAKNRNKSYIVFQKKVKYLYILFYLLFLLQMTWQERETEFYSLIILIVLYSLLTLCYEDSKLKETSLLLSFVGSGLIQEFVRITSCLWEELSRGGGVGSI